MTLKIVAAFDKKTALYDRPFMVRHLGEALREWEIVCKDKNTKFGRNPEDWDIYVLGEFDDESGELIPGKKTHIASGLSDA